MRRDGTSVWSRFSATPGDIVWYYQQVHSVVADRLPGGREGMGGELGAVVEEIRRLADNAAA